MGAVRVIIDSNIHVSRGRLRPRPLIYNPCPMKKLALILLLAASAAPQTLSPAVKEYVKVEAPTVVLTHVRVIDGTGAPAKEGQTVVIFGGRIESVSDSKSAKLVKDAKWIDATGMTLLPGLVLLHEHMFYPAG